MANGSSIFDELFPVFPQHRQFDPWHRRHSPQADGNIVFGFEGRDDARWT